ncbi:MAG: DUF2073 domain-containing protein, partial [Candidatus Nanoarchaeia archaeon]|nr:DUF2073 domain-containing protein [Candidatus Nanoarchaeia archaeon]
DKRYEEILNYVKENFIVLVDGNFTKDDEIQLLKITMEHVNTKFKGIEFASFNPVSKKNINFFKNIKLKLANWLSGSQGLTLIGRSEIIKDIKKDPDKIELMTKN